MSQDPTDGAERAEDRLELYRDPSEPPLALTGSRSSRLIVIGGAKGGVGKSMLVANLGLYLASLGRRVLLVDADAEGANLEGMLGPGAGVSEIDASSEPVATPIAGLSLWRSGLDDAPRGATRRRTRPYVLHRLRELDFDHIVVDLGSGMHRSLFALWFAADLALSLVVPEPGAVENTYRFVRAAFLRHLVRAASSPEQRDRLRARLRAFGPAPGPDDVARRLEASGDRLAETIRAAIESFTFTFVVNQARVRADTELGSNMRAAARERLGLRLTYGGHIDWDDAAWAATRAGRPLLLESPGARASRAIERLVRRLTGSDASARATMPEAPRRSHHALLDLERGASDEEVRRATKRARDVFSPGGLAVHGLYDAEGLRAIRARIDEASEVLLDPVRRPSYEASIFPSGPASDDRQAVLEPPRPEGPLPEVNAETEFTGALLRALREARGLGLEHVSQRTKVRTTYLEALEADAFDRLPAPVYVRGFVQQFARLLGVDPALAASGYTARYERFLARRELPR